MIKPCASRHLALFVLGSVLWLSGLSSASGQVGGAQGSVAPLDTANDKLKTCLQRHYQADNDSTSQYRLGDDLVAACRTEWDQAIATCTDQAKRPTEYCTGQTNMMLMGFVPMH